MASALNLDVAAEIIAHADRDVLLTLSSTSRDFCRLCRPSLFDTVTIRESRNDKHIIAFFDLLSHPQATIASAIRALVFNGPFRSDAFIDKNNPNLPKIAPKLINAAFLRFHTVPSTVYSFPDQTFLDFIFNLPVSEVEIELMWINGDRKLISFWNHLPKSMKKINLYKIRLISPEVNMHGKNDENENVSPAIRRLGDDFYIDGIDNTSLESLQTVGILKIDEALHLDKLYLSFRSTASRCIQDISSFLRASGTNIKSLIINLNDSLPGTEGPKYYSRVGLASCTNLRAISIGTIGLDNQARAEDTIWTILRVLPSSSTSHVKIIFGIKGDDFQDKLDNLSWRNLIIGLRKKFPQLSVVNIWIGSRLPETQAVGASFSVHLLETVSEVAGPTRVFFEIINWAIFDKNSTMLSRGDFLVDSTIGRSDRVGS